MGRGGIEPTISLDAMRGNTLFGNGSHHDTPITTSFGCDCDADGAGSFQELMTVILLIYFMDQEARIAHPGGGLGI